MKRGPRAQRTARSYNADRREEAIAAGKCRTCLRDPADPGRATCAACRQAGRDRMRRLRSLG